MFKVKCYANIDDVEPADVLEAETYSVHAEADNVSRIVINPYHLDPTKSAQIHVASGTRGPTDPKRYARVEVWQDAQPETDTLKPQPARLVCYRDAEGHASQPVEVADEENDSAEDMTEEEEVKGPKGNNRESAR